MEYLPATQPTRFDNPGKFDLGPYKNLSPRTVLPKPASLPKPARREDPTLPERPSWYKLKTSEILYAFEMKTRDATGDAPWVTLYGTKGLSKRFKLDNAPDNFQVGKKDYFLYSADEIGDVGIPELVKFEEGGDDGWQFSELRVDVFAGSTWKMRDFADFLGDWNDRDRVINHLNVRQVLAMTIEFPGIGGVDGNGGSLDGIKLQRTQLMMAEDFSPPSDFVNVWTARASNYPPAGPEFYGVTPTSIGFAMAAILAVSQTDSVWRLVGNCGLEGHLLRQDKPDLTAKAPPLKFFDWKNDFAK